MNWDKAKNLIVFCLLMINLFLYVLIYINENQYVLTSDQEHAILTLLAQNNITMNAQVIKEFKPMRQIAIAQYRYDVEALLKIFFDDLQGVKKTEEYDKTIFKHDNGNELTIQNGYITFENPNGSAAIELNSDSAVALSKEYIKKMSGIFSGMEFDGLRSYDDGYVVIYRQRFNNYIIHSNFVEFYVNENGIVQIECMYGQPEGFIGKTRDISSSDESLYTFLWQIKNIYGNDDALINKMDLVYYQEDSNPVNGDTLKAVPFYRIFIDGIDTPFLINAYTNMVI